MTKRIPLFVAVILIAVPFFSVHAEKATYDNAYQAIVQIKTFTQDNLGNLVQYSSGSGVIISSDGLVLTNAHVTSVINSYDDSDRPAVYQVCITEDANTAPDCSYTGRLVSSDEDLDISLIKIHVIPSYSSRTQFSYLDILPNAKGVLNTAVRAMGYPAIGGETITISEGTISGSVGKYGEYWLKTDAVTSFGSSGGALVNKEGQIVGITTQSYSDLLGSLGYAISMDTVGPWVQSQTGNAAITSTLEGRLLELMSRTKDLNKTSLYQSTKPPFSLTRPADWKFTQYDDTELYIDKPTDKEGGVFDLTLHRLPRQVSYEDIQTYLQANAFDAGVSSVINIADKGLVTFGNTKAKKYTITGSGTNSDAYYILQGDYFMVVTYKYGKDDKDKAKIDSIITSFKLGSYQFTGTTSSSFKSDNPKFSYTLSSGWVMQPRMDSKTPVRSYHNTWWSIKSETELERFTEANRHMTNEEYLNQQITTIEQAAKITSSVNLGVKVLQQNPHVKLNDEITDAMMLEVAADEVASGKPILRDFVYIIRGTDSYISVDVAAFGDLKNYDAAKADFTNSMKSFHITGVNSVTPTPTPTPTPSLTPAPAPVTPIGSDDWSKSEADQVKSVNQTLVVRMKGRILLQVEAHGEAWYVDPVSGKKYYMKDGQVAYSLMRSFGVGISDADLAKIPTGPNDKNVDKALVNRMKGKILLQVQQHGEAWYVNPVDGYRYYLKDGQAAYQIMRKLGAGIANKDLRTISVGTIK